MNRQEILRDIDRRYKEITERSKAGVRHEELNPERDEIQKMYHELLPSEPKGSYMVLAQGHAFYGVAIFTVETTLMQIMEALRDCGLPLEDEETSIGHDSNDNLVLTTMFEYGGPRTNEMGTGVLVRRIDTITAPRPTVLYDSGHCDEDMRVLTAIYDTLA